MSWLKDIQVKRVSKQLRKQAERNATAQAGLNHFRRTELARSVSTLILPPVDKLDEECREVAIGIGVDHAVFNVITDEAQISRAGWGYEDNSFTTPNPLGYSVCMFVVAREQPLVIDNTLESEVSICLSVPEVRAYAGVPVVFQGYIIGALAAWHTKPFHFAPEHLDMLKQGAARIEQQIRVMPQRPPVSL